MGERRLKGVRECRWFSEAWAFTLIELVILMAVIMVMAVFAAEEVRKAIQTSRLSAATAKALSDVRYAQQLARTHNGWYGMRFLVSPTNQYVVYSTDGVTDTPVKDPVNLAQNLQITVSAVFGGVAISGVSIGGGNQVEFNPTGTPYSDKNGAALAADGTVTLALGGTSRVITIIKNTGRAE
jgi:Tfp pilus assembly protein FimT